MGPARYFGPPLLVVGAMLTATTLTGQRDFIFPEGAALTFGVVVMADPAWSVSPLRLILVPTLCAILGHLLAGLGAPAWPAELAGVTGAFLVLTQFGSRIAPALSAAVLPVVFGVRSWLYPAVVLATCLTIVAIALFPSTTAPGSTVTGNRSWPIGVVVRGWIVITTWIIVAGPLLGLTAPALAPPLFVSAFEWLSTDRPNRASGRRRVALVTGAALAGATACALIPTPVAAGATGVAVTLALGRKLCCPHAPALAIALIPLITHAPNPIPFTISIFVEATALYGIAAALGFVQHHFGTDGPHESQVTASR